MTHFKITFRTSLNGKQISYSAKTNQMQFGNSRVHVCDEELDDLYYAKQMDNVGAAYSIYERNTNNGNSISGNHYEFA